MNGQRHRQAAADQHSGVGSAQLDIEDMASCDESGQMNVPVNSVAGEHAAKEKNLSTQEKPHAQRAGIALLLEIVELVCQTGHMTSSGMTIGQRTTSLGLSRR